MRFIVVLFCLLNFCPAVAQQDSLVLPHKVRYDHSSTLRPVVFDEDHIEELKQSDDFDYIQKEQEKTWWQRFKSWINEKYKVLLRWLFGDYDAGSFFGFVIKLLPYLLLLGILGLILWLFTRINPAKNILEQPKNPAINLNDDEAIVQNADISSLIDSAIENKQYRLAVRYYYLQALKELDLKKLIRFEAQKTNTDYIAEINDPKLIEPFKKVTRIYNFIWYGDFMVSKADFKLAQYGFQDLNLALKSKNDE